MVSWTRVFIRVARAVWITTDDLFLSLIGLGDEPTQIVEAAPTGRRAVLVFQGPAENSLDAGKYQISFDFLNITDDEVDDTWDATDFETVEGHIDTLWDSMKARISDEVTLEEIRWYRFGPDVGPPNPAVRVLPVNDPGSATTVLLPSQVAMSVTEITPVRRSWGRVYWPGLTAAIVTTDNGTWSQASIAAVADEHETFYEACYGDDFIPVVWSPTHESALSITKVQVDNIPDVIRARRYPFPSFREVRPV